MIKVLSVSLFILFSLSSHAGEVKASAKKQRGVMETMEIRYFQSNWGYEFQVTGFTMGTARVNVVPVSREAFEVLQSLNQKSTYTCVLEKSTYVPKRDGSIEVGGTYFVLDINCN